MGCKVLWLEVCRSAPGSILSESVGQGGLHRYKQKAGHFYVKQSGTAEPPSLI